MIHNISKIKRSSGPGQGAVSQQGTRFLSHIHVPSFAEPWVFVTVLFLFATVLPSPGQTITWLHPTRDGGYEVESAIEELEIDVRVTNHQGKEVSSADDLRRAGYEWSADGFWQNHTRNPKGKGRLNVRVSGLPPGRHDVYIRYFEMPRLEGDPWHYFPRFYFGSDPKNMERVRPREKRIIAGVGQADEERSNVYDGRIGTVGKQEKGATGFVLGFDKYRWTDTVRYGSIRIETDLSIDRVRTLEDTPLNREIRSRLLAGGPEENGKPVYGVATVSSTLKVRPKRFDALQGRKLSNRLDLFGARGEDVARQVVVHSPGRALTDVALECSSLTNEKGQKISPGAIQFAPVGYVEVHVPHVPSEHGWWPEPILTFLDRLRIKRGDVQSLWYEVHVPRDAEAGVYRGKVTIKPGNAPVKKLPVKLRVRDFSVPKMPYLRVVGGIKPLQHAEYLMEFGINPTSIYGMSIFKQKDEENVIEKLRAWKEAGATAINLGYINERPRDPKTGEPAVPDEETVQDWVDKIGRNYRLVTKAGLRDAAYVYMYDEANQEWAPTMKTIANRLRSEFPNLLLLTTAHLFDHSDLSAINGWCPVAKNLEAFRKQRKKALTQDRELWWYTMNSPPRPWPNLFLTQPATAHRQLMGFSAFAAGTDGYLYYAFQGSTARQVRIENGPYTDIWSKFDGAAAILNRKGETWMYLNGPGGLDDPLPSMRLTAIRAGLQDYNYLYLARRFRNRLRKAGLETAELRETAEWFQTYANPGNNLITNLKKYVQDPEKIQEVKKRLGAYIEKARRKLARKQE